MGRFNSRGEYLAGIAGGPMSVSGKPIGALGHGVWLNDDEIVAGAGVGGVWGLYSLMRGPDDVWTPSRLDRAGRIVTRVEDAAPGATAIGGGAGNWAATFESHPHETYGQWRSAPLPPEATAGHVLDGGRDGTLVFHSADFQDLVILWPDGLIETRRLGATFIPRDVRAIDGGVVYLTTRLELMLYLRGSSPVPIRTFETAGEPYSFISGRARWFLYHNERTLLHRLGEDVGHIFPAGYHPDVSIGARNTIGYAVNEEGLDGIRIEGFELGAGLAPLVPPIRLPDFAPFTHPVLIAPFKDPDGQSGAPAEIVVNGTDQSVARPYFVADGGLNKSFKGTRLGIYSEAADPTAVVAIAAREGTRVLLCHDAISAWDLPTRVLRPWDIPCLELYRYSAESLAQSVTRWHAAAMTLLASWSGDCGVIPMFYCQGGAPPNEVWSVQAVLDGLGALSEIVNLSPRITIVAPFSFQRANGIVGHPELRQAFDRLLAASTMGLPILHPIGAVIPVTPVTPKPSPTPAPVVPPAPPSEEPDMFYLVEKPIPATAYDLVPRSNGEVALKRPSDGKFMEVDAFGNVKFVDEPNDGDASFKRGQNGGLVAHDRGGDKKCFAIEGVEA